MEHFLACALVDSATGQFQQRLAHQLFYGRLDDSYPINFPDNFDEFYKKLGKNTQGEELDKLIVFLNFIGIHLRQEQIQKHLSIFPDDFLKIHRNAYYIFKTLAHYGDTFEVSKPFKDIGNNVYFLLRVEAGEISAGNQLELFEDLSLPELYNKFTSLPDGYGANEIIQNLFRLIEDSNESYFITGKAGTGKSTFIQYVARTTKKRILKLAFTGIAAINVGGQTIHSFFLFPLKPMLPEDEEIFKFKETSDKYKLIQLTDTFIIDEVSMLRSDILEAIDYSLRINGGNPYKRFGGKQILFVGDIFQLPPVHNKQDEVEKMVFTEEYKSEYFFDAPAYRELGPTFFEFQKSYRQKSDLIFVELLDSVRICRVSETTLNLLNERYIPTYEPQVEEFVIHLTTTNILAHSENKKRLLALPFTSFVFEAKIAGEFNADKFPTTQHLELKKHAQVIFIKNDSAQKWVNGTIAKVDFISSNLLEIRLQDGSTHKLEPVTWENRKYRYDRGQRKIVSEVIGTFTQYPIKLAWAITIHKSQGLSFDKVLIDLGSGAFVNGQVYTALSRCRTLDGVVLKRRLKEADIIGDERIINFYQTEKIIHTLLD